MTEVGSRRSTTSLAERKRQQVRLRIIEAADQLFSIHGFSNVSVTDIATQAEVGRTTFFRYFGDKTEVVFAREQTMLDTVALAENDNTAATARTPSEAIEQLRPIVLDLCRQAAEDHDAYHRRSTLLELNPDLRARDALKKQQIASRLSQLLQRRGTPQSVAILAAQLALACYETARLRAATAANLTEETQAAFNDTLALSRR